MRVIRSLPADVNALQAFTISNQWVIDLLCPKSGSRGRSCVPDTLNLEPCA